METVLELMTDIVDAGIDIRVENGRLKVRSNTGTPDEDLLNRIKASKSELISYLDLSSDRVGLEKLELVKAPVSKSVTRFPLSFAQKRIWFIEQMMGKSTLYNMPSVINIDFEFDVELGQKVFESMISRHESLRTLYQVDEKTGEPVQYVVDKDEFRLHYVDVSETEENLREIELNTHIKSITDYTFDISSDLLIKAKYIQISNQHGLLVCNTHHIAADGWSTTLLEMEFLSSYKQLESDSELFLERPKFSYIDYSYSQQFWYKSERYKSQLDYWSKSLENLPLSHSLPLDFNRSCELSKEGELIEFKTSIDTLQRIQRLSRKYGVTLFTMLHAVFSLIVARCSNTQDVVLGTIVANRTHPELSSIVGFFANSLVLRTKCDTLRTFAEYLEHVKNVNLNALNNQDIPFDTVVEKLNPERNSNINPLFQILLTLNNNQYVSDVDEKSFRQRAYQTTTSKFDLTVHALELDDGLLFAFEYATSLFKHTTIEQLARRFLQLLESIDGLMDCEMFKIDLNLPEEKEILSSRFVQVESQNNRLAHQFLEERARANPELCAIEFQGKKYSYCELNSIANQIAHRLIQLGVSPGCLVGLCLERSVNLVAAVFAILKCGAAYVPLDISYPFNRKKLIFEESKVSHLVTGSCFKDITDLAMNNGSQVLIVDDIVNEFNRTPEFSINPDLGSEIPLNSNAFIIYTSGSTGMPKGVVQTHLMLSNLIIAQSEQFDISTPKRTIQFAPITFDPSIHEMLTCCYTGSVLVLISEDEKAELEKLAEIYIKYKIERIFIPPAVLNFLMEESSVAQQKNFKLSEIFASGEQLTMSSALVNFLENKEDCRLFNIYGPTETHVITGGLVEQYTVAANPDIGVPLLNINCQILDENLGVTPFGAIGELYASGPCLASGYHRNQELTEEKFIKSPINNERMYRTGDLVRYNSSGRIDFIGRVDDQVKLRGFRVELKEIEKALCTHDSVKTAVVLFTAKGIDSFIEAFVTTHQAFTDVSEVSKAIRVYLLANLPYYMVPTSIFVVNEIPFNHNGKIDRKKLSFLVEQSHTTEDVSLSTKTEITLAQIWSELLGIAKSKVKTNSNFFMSGGHSLLGARLVSRIRTEFDKYISLKDLFESPTVKELASLIAAAPYIDKDVMVGSEQLKAEWNALSYSQRRIWFLYKMEPDSAQYNLSLTFTVGTSFCIERANKAINSIVYRHEMLRTTFRVFEDKVVRQKIKKPFLFAIEQVKLETQPPKDIESFVRTRNSKPFNLCGDILFRVEYIYTSDGVGVLNFCIHHIIADGWSLNIAAEEFLKVYDSQENKSLSTEVTNLSKVTHSYLDYVSDQISEFGSSANSGALEYWTHYLQDAPATHSIPLDYPRKVNREKKGAEVTNLINANLLERLQEFAFVNNSTLFMLLQTVFAAFLCRWSGTNEIVMAAPIHGRKKSQYEGVIGLFLNNKIFRAIIESDSSLETLLSKTRQYHLESEGFDDVPFEMIVEKINPKRSVDYHPIFQVFINYDNTKQLGLSEDGEWLAPLSNCTVLESKYDISLYIADINSESGKSLALTWLFDANLFKADTLTRMANEFNCFLKDSISKPNLPLLSLAWNTPSRLSRPNIEFEDVILSFEKVVCITPDSIAIVDDAGAMTYRELNHQVNRLAWFLHDKWQVKPEDRVAVSMERSASRVVTILAILKLGACYVPLSEELPLARNSTILSLSEAKLIIMEKSSLRWLEIESLSVPFVLYDGLETKKALNEQSESNYNLYTPSPDATSHVIFTSGSTGTPKGIIGTRKSLSARVGWMVEEFDFREKPSIHITSMLFIRGLWELLVPLCASSKLYLSSRDILADPKRLTDFLACNSIQQIVTAPSLMRVVAKYLLTSQTTLPDLKYWFLSGEEIPSDYMELAVKTLAKTRFINLYGSTETMSDVLYGEVNVNSGDASNLLTKILPGNEALILDRFGNQLPRGVVGELVISGSCVGMGYIDNLENNSFHIDEFNRRRFNTGDLAISSNDGSIKLLGRKDNEIKIRGYRINLSEIEYLLRSEPVVNEAAVLVVGNDLLEKRLNAYICLSEIGRAASLGGVVDSLKNRLKKRLPKYMIPADINVVKEIPIKANGKVDRLLLLEAFVQKSSTSEREVTETAKKLMEVWEKILNKSDFSIYDDFFEVGGNSLLVLTLIEELNDVMDVRLKPTHIFENSTLNSLSSLIEKRSKRSS